MEASSTGGFALTLTRFLVRLFSMVVFILLLLSVHWQSASAQSASACQEVVDYLDLTADGLLDAMVLSCQFSPDTHDQLIIYKQSGNLLTNIPWQQNIDYEDEIWIFDHNTQGRASLLINFRRDESALSAELYDDRNEDGEVSYTIHNGKLEITENEYWTAQVIAPEGWWVRDGIPNYNLHIQVDGDVEGMFMMESYRGGLVTDGKPDFDIRIYDQNNNGKPEFDKRMILTDWLQDSVGLGTQMMANWEDDEPQISGAFSLWPYLDLTIQTSGGSNVVKDYHASPPPIKFIPDTGRIEAISEFVASRGGEHNCFYYSAIPWFEGQVNEADFENPFCFYDLAQDDDGIPELQVRSSYWPPYDPKFPGGVLTKPFEWIRYSWDQENIGTWRYAVGLIGRHLIDSRVSFDDIDVLTIPYVEFPTWIIERNWDMVVFSEFTGERYFTSEGNYSVSYLEDLQFPMYYTGQSDSAPSPEYDPEVNFRMEWSMDHANRSLLYFSPVDHRLHLLGASGGSWKIDESRSIQYGNLGDGDYINQWALLTDGQLKKSLSIIKDMIILYEDATISIFQMAMLEDPIVTSPPSNHDEWVKLGKFLDQQKTEFPPEDFWFMANQFGGTLLFSMTGAALRDLRLEGDGFRFVLLLEPGFHYDGSIQLGLEDVNPGEYALVYDGSGYSVQPLTPASLATDEIQIGSPTMSEWTTIESTVQNEGLEDIYDLVVCANVAGPLEESEVYSSTIELLPGEGSQVLRWDWAPSSTGEWNIMVEVGCGTESTNHQILAEATTVVSSKPTPSPAWFLTLGSTLSDQVIVLVIVFFANLILFAGGFVYIWLRITQFEERGS